MLLLGALGFSGTLAEGAKLSRGEEDSRQYKAMGKRIMLVVVGAGIGSLAGLLVSFLGAGNWALIAGAVVGGAIPPLVLGPPSRPS